MIVSLCSVGQDWRAARQAGHGPLHILRPMDLNIDLHKCMVQDKKLPKLVTGQ